MARVQFPAGLGVFLVISMPKLALGQFNCLHLGKRAVSLGVEWPDCETGNLVSSCAKVNKNEVPSSPCMVAWSLGTFTRIHVSQPHKISVTVVFDSGELLQSPDDDPQGSKRLVIIKPRKHTPVLVTMFIVVVMVRNSYIIWCLRTAIS
jgi:hypothetical protein